MKKKEKKLTIRLEPSLLAKLEELASDWNMTRSAFSRLAVSSFIDAVHAFRSEHELPAGADERIQDAAMALEGSWSS